MTHSDHRTLFQYHGRHIFLQYYRILDLLYRYVRTARSNHSLAHQSHPELSLYNKSLHYDAKKGANLTFALAWYGVSSSGFIGQCSLSLRIMIKTSAKNIGTTLYYTMLMERISHHGIIDATAQTTARLKCGSFPSAESCITCNFFQPLS